MGPADRHGGRVPLADTLDGGQPIGDRPSICIIGGSALVAGALLLLFTATHDHARIHSAATGTGAAGAYVWALGFVVARERRALPLLGMLLLTGGAGWCVYQTLGRLLVTTSTTGVVGALLWGELLMVCRMFLRVWSFAAQTELQHLSDLTPG